MNQNIIRLTFTYSSNIIAHTQSTGDQNAELQLIAKDYEGIWYLEFFFIKGLYSSHHVNYFYELMMIIFNIKN